MIFDHIDIKPVLNAEQLESLRFQLLRPSHGRVIERSTLVTSEGELKALYLKANGNQPIPEGHYKPALTALKLMSFNPSKDTNRPMVKQARIGGELLLGWLRPRSSREDWLRKGDRDQLFLALRLAPLIRDFEYAMQEHLPAYWQFHLSQAMRLVRPAGERFKTLHRVQDPFQRQMLTRWDATRYYHFLGSQAFSTITLNRNILFGAHDDGRNVPGTLGCLTALGDYAKGSGVLCFPRLGIAFDLRPQDLLIADTNNEYHASVGGICGTRYSVVAYLHKSLLPKT